MNDTERHELLTKMFLAARKLPKGERTAFLKEECGGDDSLFVEIQRMISDDLENSGFLAAPALGSQIETLLEMSAELPAGSLPERIGSFKILGLLGDGGMGYVYLAEQENPRRRVALKVIRPGITSNAAFKRFEMESHILGRLQHSGIAQVFEAGIAQTDSDRQPYFAMEYVEGLPLTEYAEKHSLGTRERLGLMARVCEAVHHAHQKGIVHRDLKPSNILVDSSGTPKVLDFGVARATDSDVKTTTMRTEVGQLIGTISYMSPEQVAGDPELLDTRSDVYSLGVICYKLLAGTLPYDLTDKIVPEVTRIIRDDEPTPLSSVNRMFRGDVETIVRKALEKDRKRRYQSAFDLAADLSRFIRNEPVVARPPSTMYQLRKFSSRNRGLVSGFLFAFIALAAGTSVATWQAIVARAEADRATKAERLAATQTEFLSSILVEASPETRDRHDITLMEVLAEAAASLDGKYPNQPMAEASLRGTLGYTFLTLLAFGEAETELRKQRNLLTPLVNENDPRLLRNAHYLSRALNKQGRADEAAPLLEQSLRHQIDSEGISMPTLGMMLTCARNYRGLQQNDEAEALYHKIIDLVREYRKQVNHPLELICKAELAKLHASRGENATAEELLIEVLEVRREKYKPGEQGYKDMLTAMHNLAGFYIRQTRPAEAEPLLIDALPELRKVWGAGHSEVIKTELLLGRVFYDRGKYDAAATLIEQTLIDSKESQAPDHPLTRDANSLLEKIQMKTNGLPGQ